jgi:hypothetical protein
MTQGALLVELGRLDLALMREEKVLDEIPEKLEILRLRKRLKEIEGVLEKADAYCRTAEAMVRKSAAETALVQAKIDAEQSKVLSGSVTNPKELQSLTRELEALSRRKSAIEDETLALMEKSEAGAAQREKVEATLAQGHAKEAELIAAFREKGGEMQRAIEKLRAERTKVIAGIDPALLDKYEALRAAKHGVAVGVLEGDVCSACRTHLPADRAQAIALGPEVAECPNCRRLLVVVAGADS